MGVKIKAVNGVVAKRAVKATQRKGAGQGLKGQVAGLFSGNQRTTYSKAVLLATFTGQTWQQICNAVSNCQHRQPAGSKTVIKRVYKAGCKQTAINMVGYKYSHSA